MFLNIIISKSDLRMDSKKIKIIVNWIISINLEKIQDFVDFTNFNRRFITKSLKIIRFLMKLTRKVQFFIWDEICFKAFQEFRNRVVFTFIFRYSDSKKLAVLKIDLFDWITDNMFSQYNNDEILHPMIFYSKSLNFVEINYHIYNKKLLIIICCVEHWRFELVYMKFSIQIFIDHQTLKIFKRNKQLIYH